METLIRPGSAGKKASVETEEREAWKLPFQLKRFKTCFVNNYRRPEKSCSDTCCGLELNVTGFMIKGVRRRVFEMVAVAAILAFCVLTSSAQQVVDRTVAVLSDGTRTELITYSDLLWQLALQPDTPIDPPRHEDLQQALQTLIDQRLFALEAQRIPRKAPTDAEIAAKIQETLSRFPSTAIFEKRLQQVGFESIKDDNFERLIGQRLDIENYIAFRFESFVVVTPDEEKKYYRDNYVPAFRTRSPGVLVPTFEQRQAEIHAMITQQKVAASIERFVDEAKQRVQIDILYDV